MRAFLINSLANVDSMAVFSCHLSQINHVILEVEGKRNQVPPVLPKRNGYMILDECKFLENGENFLLFNSEECDADRILVFGT